jgi:hypothetical protein
MREPDPGIWVPLFELLETLCELEERAVSIRWSWTLKSSRTSVIPCWLIGDRASVTNGRLENAST